MPQSDPAPHARGRMRAPASPPPTAFLDDDKFPDTLLVAAPIDLTGDGVQYSDWSGLTDSDNQDQEEEQSLGSSDLDSQDQKEEEQEQQDPYESSDDEVIHSIDPRRVGPAANIQDLQDEVNKLAKDYGFAVTRHNGSNKQGGEYTRYDFRCDRYGYLRPSRSVGLRLTSSRKCGCAWKAHAVKVTGGWILCNTTDPVHHTHNHNPSLDPSTHPQLREITTEIREDIADISKHNGIRAREFGAIIGDRFPGSSFKRQDIYNARASIRADNLSGYTAAGALIAAFDKEGINYIVKWEDEAKTQLVGLAFTLDECMELTEHYSESMIIDNTYSTNSMGYPLFQVTGMTATGTIFNSVFGLINNKKTEAFTFLCQATKELRARRGIRKPDVIITVDCDAMKAAVTEVFPNSQQQLCRFYIVSRVLANAKLRWISGSEPDSEEEDDSDPNEQGPVEIIASDRAILARIRSSNPEPQPGATPVAPEPTEHTYRGVVAMFKAMVYAKDEPSFIAA